MGLRAINLLLELHAWDWVSPFTQNTWGVRCVCRPPPSMPNIPIIRAVTLEVGEPCSNLSSVRFEERTRAHVPKWAPNHQVRSEREWLSVLYIMEQRQNVNLILPYSTCVFISLCCWIWIGHLHIFLLLLYEIWFDSPFWKPTRQEAFFINLYRVEHLSAIRT